MKDILLRSGIRCGYNGNYTDFPGGQQGGLRGIEKAELYGEQTGQSGLPALPDSEIGYANDFSGFIGERRGGEPMENPVRKRSGGCMHKGQDEEGR